MWKKIIIKFYFYCTKIRALLRTSLMFLWELKNAIISQNLRELCDIKANTKNPHTVASTSSATYYFITRCLSLSKAHSHFSSRCLSLLKAHSHFSSRCLSLSKAVLIPPCDFDSAQSPYYLLLHSVPEPVEGTFSILISVPERSRRHIISIVLKYVCFLEHLWCSFENSKTPSFQQISANFVL